MERIITKVQYSKPRRFLRAVSDTRQLFHKSKNHWIAIFEPLYITRLNSEQLEDLYSHIRLGNTPIAGSYHCPGYLHAHVGLPSRHPRPTMNLRLLNFFGIRLEYEFAYAISEAATKSVTRKKSLKLPPSRSPIRSFSIRFPPGDYADDAPTRIQ